MIGFILRRLASLVLVLWCVVTLVFVLVRLMPGGPFDKERKIPARTLAVLKAKFHIDAPEARSAGEFYARILGWSEKNASRAGEAASLAEQYRFYLWRLLHGDLLISTKYLSRSVNEIIAQTLPVSIALGLAAFLIATTGGIALGSWAAVRHHTAIDTGAMFAALLAISVPTFVTGPVLILLFGLKLGWLPVGGWHGTGALILPALTLGAPYVAYIARLMRGSMLEVLGQDFIRTARAKGLPGSRIVYKHAAKVAILPVVSFLGPLAANLVTGSIVIETVFNIPGMGGFFVNSVLNRDGFLLSGVVIVYVALLVGLNLLVDIAYAWIDPRITLHD